MGEVYKPPFEITDKIIDLVSEISERIGSISITSNMNQNPKLRRENRIKTIQASLAIENNTLTLDQVTDIINGKRVLGYPNEITEVKNAYTAYERLLELNPLNTPDILRAHGLLMDELVKNAGKFRNEGVGIFDGDKVVHLVTPARLVPELIGNLINWYKDSTVHPLIKSCVFHYEFEFIHPFADGNGRMGRMWHTLLLSKWKEIFAWIPVETLIKERQIDYYRVLGEADSKGDSTVFVEFMLQVMGDALMEIVATDQVTDQVEALLKILGNQEMSALELMDRLELSHKPTFRKNYLTPAMEAGVIERTIPDKPKSSRQKYKRSK